MSMNPRNKICVGSTLCALGGSGIVLTAIVGAFPLLNPVGISLLFAAGMSAGLGAVLALCGLYQQRHANPAS